MTLRCLKIPISTFVQHTGAKFPKWKMREVAEEKISAVKEFQKMRTNPDQKISTEPEHSALSFVQ